MKGILFGIVLVVLGVWSLAKTGFGAIWPCFCPTRPLFLRAIPHWGHQKAAFLSDIPHFLKFARVQ